MVCDKCDLHKSCFTKGMSGFGSDDSEVLIIGVSPSLAEDSSGRVGIAEHSEVRRAFDTFGLPYKDYKYTNIVKCCSRGIELNNDIMWSCRDFLVDEIKAMPNLRIILGLGAEVYHVLTTTNKPKRKPIAIGKRRGLITHLDEFNVDFIPTYNPLAISRNPKFRNNFHSDIKSLNNYLSNKEDKLETNYNSIYVKDDVDWFFNQLFEQTEVAFDIETTSKDSPYGARVLCITFSWGEGNAFYLPINEGDKGNYWINNWGEDYWQLIYDNIFDFYQDSSIKKIGHNIKYDILYSEVIFDAEVNGIYFDTMLAHYLMNVDSLHDLKTLSRQYTDLENYEDKVQDAYRFLKKDKSILPENMNFGAIDIDLIREYALTDADATFRLYKLFKDKIDGASYKSVFYDILMPLTRVLLDAEKAGVRVDKELMLKLQNDYGKVLYDIQEELDLYIFVNKAKEYDIDNFNLYFDTFIEKKYVIKEILHKNRYAITEVIGDGVIYTIMWLSEDVEQVFMITTEEHPDYKFKELNCKSPLQLRRLLFKPKPEGLGLKALKLTPTEQDSTDKDSLELLNRKEKNPVLDKIVKFRAISTLKSTFIDGMIAKIDPITKRIHPNYKIHGTRTGRLSMGAPNLLNIPRDSEDAGKIRNIFLPDEGHVFVDGDAAQAEFRILCEYSKDPVMLKLFKDEVDIHRLIASRVYHLPEDKITKEQRNFVKGIVFGTMYGRGAKAVASELGIPEKDAYAIQDYFFRLCPGGKAWLDGQTRFVKSKKFVKTLFGRVRPLYDIDSNEPGIASATMREATNTPIQSAASDYVLIAMIRIYNEIKKRGLKALPKITVYDSIIVDTLREQAKEVYDIMEHYMTSKIKPVHLVPMKCEIKVVDRWSGEKVEI